MKYFTRAILCVALLVGGGSFSCSDTSDLDNKPALKHGMTVDEVAKIMGDPISEVPNLGVTLRTYQFKGKRYLVHFEHDEVVQIQPLWGDSTCLMGGCRTRRYRTCAPARLLPAARMSDAEE